MARHLVQHVHWLNQDLIRGANYLKSEFLFTYIDLIRFLRPGFSSFGAIQQYPQVNYPGSGLGAIQLNGTATMLIEVKGQTQTLGQKQNGMLKQTVKTPIYDILNKIADGSIENVDADLYDEIPAAYGRTSDPSTRY